MTKLPYGRAAFRSLILQGYYYVDRTPFLSVLEQLGESYLFFLRPRRFGKSLWLSTLAHYYGFEHADEFDHLFGQLHVGHHPTTLANQYLVLTFDFSGIDTQERAEIKGEFWRKVKWGIWDFADRYPDLQPLLDLPRLFQIESPAGLIGEFLQSVKRQPRKVYLLIDEYDHFTNELISFDITHFQEIASRQGWVRKFYEVIKTAAGQGVIDRMFITGVSPVTLDSLTSGFNIGTNLSQDPELHGLMGFTEAETIDILKTVGVTPEQLSDVTGNVRRWYNGYRFTTEGEPDRLYNPDMVLYFAKEYQKRQSYPPKLLDTNISPDYGKIRRTFHLGNAEFERQEILRRILSEGSIPSNITEQFSFERTFTQEDFLSLLYFLGLLTIQTIEVGTPVLAAPNLVVETLYVDYFREVLANQIEEMPSSLDVRGVVLEMAKHNRPQALLNLVAQTLSQASNRDLIHLNETGIKMIMMSYLHTAQVYYLRSEHEVERGYVDLLALHKPPIETPYQFVFELKHLKQKDEGRLDSAVQEGYEQLRRYYDTEEIQAQPNVRCWLAVFVGTDLRVIEEVEPEGGADS